MDFTPELTMFQGAIISADNVHHFSRLSLRGGNTTKIEYVIQYLQNFLKSQRYVDENVPTVVAKPMLRKFAMYIILNADLTVLEEMVGMDTVDMVIWTIPTVPKHLMCELLWNLHMEEFIYDIITYVSPELSIGVADAFIHHFKYFSPTECLQKLKHLCLACYKFIGQFNHFELPDDKLNTMLTSAMDNLQKCLLYYTTPPNSQKLNALSKDELYKYNGDTLQSVLLLIWECFHYYSDDTNWSKCDDLYKVTYKEGSLKENLPFHKISESQNPIIIEYLNNSNKALLDVFQVVVMGISVDIFCAWSEFEENGKTMQQSVGELCHKIRMKLLNIESVSEHPVINMIQQMARKPINVADIINTFEPDAILQKINSNDEDKAIWIHALINREDVYLHDELLHTMDVYLHTFKKPEYPKLYNKFTDYLNISSTNLELLKSLAVKAFYHCDVLDKHKLLQEHFINTSFFDLADDEQYHNRLTEMLNKLAVSNELDSSELLSAFLQNPRAVYNKSLLLAAENGQLLNPIMKIMKLIENYANYYYNNETESCLISIIKNILDKHLQIEKQRQNFIRFISGLKFNEIIPGTTLLLLIIMPVMHKALTNKNIMQLKVQVHLLNEAYTLHELLNYRAPILAMLAQVVEVARWPKMAQFTPIAPVTLQLSLRFLTNLIETYNNTVPDSEGTWLRKKLKQMKLQKLNNHYFSVLWTPRQPELIELFNVTGNVRDANRYDLTVWLCLNVIVNGIQDEWCIVWDEMATQLKKCVLVTMYIDTLRMMTRAADELRTAPARNCLYYCYSNLAYVIRYKYFEEPLNDAQVMCCLLNLTRLLNRSNPDDVTEIGNRLMPLFAYLAERRHQYSVDIKAKFKDSKYADLVNRVFAST